MYNVTPKFHQLAIQPSSKTRCRIYFIPDTVDCTDDNDVITNGTLLVRDNTDTDSGRRISGDTGVIFSNYFNTEKNIQLGCCVSNQVEMHLLNLDGALTNFTFGRCKIFLDVYNADNSTWLNCPMGVYILEQPVNSDQNVITVHGFDQMQLLDAPAETWWNTIDWSTGRVSLYTLITGICTAVGVPWSMIIEGDRNIKFMKYPYTPMDISTKSFRDVLKQIAESTGSMAYFTRNGELDLRWFSYAKVTGYATYTGQSISIADGTGKTVDSLTVQITPTQNFNGYSNPWPAGGGKNKLPPTTSVSGTQNGVTFTVNSDGSVSTSGTATDTAIFTYFPNFTDLTENEQYILSGCPTGGGMSSKYKLDYRVSGGYMTDTGAGASFTFVPLSSENSIRIIVYSGTNASGLVFKPMIRLASVSDATFAPYSNICPITGRTGVSVYVSPTQDVADATTYAVDWTSEAGTVYGGTLDVVTGVLTVDKACINLSTSWYWYIGGTQPTGKTVVATTNFPEHNGTVAICSHYKHSNTRYIVDLQLGEFIVADGGNGAYFCFKNESGGTAQEFKDIITAQETAGTPIQVCYELATPLTYQLTPTQIALILGQNYVWSDSNEAVTLTYVIELFTRYTFIVNGNDYTGLVERDSYRTAVTPVYGETIQTLDGVGHTALLRVKGSLTVKLNPQTAAQTAAICADLLNAPCEVQYKCLQRNVNVTALMVLDVVSAMFLSRCLYLGQKWNDVDEIVLKEM